jgi:hypothetical protein
MSIELFALDLSYLTLKWGGPALKQPCFSVFQAPKRVNRLEGSEANPSLIDVLKGKQTVFPRVETFRMSSSCK